MNKYRNAAISLLVSVVLFLLILAIFVSNLPKDKPQYIIPTATPLELLPSEYVGLFYTSGKPVEVRIVTIKAKRYITFHKIDNGAISALRLEE